MNTQTITITIGILFFSLGYLLGWTNSPQGEYIAQYVKECIANLITELIQNGVLDEKAYFDYMNKNYKND